MDSIFVWYYGYAFPYRPVYILVPDTFTPSQAFPSTLTCYGCDRTLTETRGRPIVHRAGGMLLQANKEFAIHGDLRAEDVFFYYTTTYVTARGNRISAR